MQGGNQHRTLSSQKKRSEETAWADYIIGDSKHQSIQSQAFNLRAHLAEKKSWKYSVRYVTVRQCCFVADSTDRRYEGS
jgi:hypothetical protein